MLRIQDNLSTGMMTFARAKKQSIVLLGLSMALALAANSGAWHGYFQGDDLDTLGWTRQSGLGEYMKWLALPLYMPSHFRPAGHLIYWLLERLAGLNFRAYLGTLQALHLLNIFLVWTLLRTLRLNNLAAGSGTLFFSFHAAVIDAYWEPQFVFDVLCATFSLACLILFARRRFVMSFVCFWLAYKSKELAVMLPFVLAGYEFWLGKRNWKALAPFLAVGLAFGVQGVLVGRQQHVGTVYALHFTWKALAKTGTYYASRVLLTPYLGFAIVPAAWIARDRRIWLGAAMFGLFLAPILPMSDRMLSVYCYLPLVGVAVVVGALAESRTGAMAIAVFLAVWLPWNYIYSRPGRMRELAAGSENRAYVAAVKRVPKTEKPSMLAGWPARLEAWGAVGAFRCIYGGAGEIHTYDEPGIGHLMEKGPVVWSWQPDSGSLALGEASRLSLLRMSDPQTIYQLGEGWGRFMDGARWMDGRARAVVYAAVGEFRCTTRLRKWRKGDATATVSVFADGNLVGVQTFHRTEEQTSVWDFAGGRGRAIAIEVVAEPDLGAPSVQVVELGFAGQATYRPR